MQDHGTHSVENRVVRFQDHYKEVVNHLRTSGVLLAAPAEVAECFRTAPEARTRTEPGNSILDCFLRLYRELGKFDLSDQKLSEVERKVRRMKVEIDALWVNDLMPAVKDIAEAVRIEQVRQNRDFLKDAAQDILVKVYERTLLECLVNWRGEGQGLFTHYLRAAVFHVKRTYENDLRERIKREETIDGVLEPADTARQQDESDARLTVASLIEEFVARVGGRREADVFFLNQDGLTHAQIAKRLGISEEYSRVLLHRAIAILRECAGLSEENDER